MNKLAHNEFSRSLPMQGEAISILKPDFSVADDEFFVRPIGPIQNKLLAALSPKDLSALLPHLEMVELTIGQELFEYGDKLRHVYFPTTAIIALLYTLGDGCMTELAVIGREGLLGISALMGERALGTALVQIPGHAYRLKVSILQELCKEYDSLQNLMMRYAHSLFTQMAQNSVCGRHYSIDHQVSRWILDRLDRLPNNELKVTQEMIGNMLGVRRESVTESLGKLQRSGLIQCRRGYITVLKRAGLEKHAGECYMVTKDELDHVQTHAA